MKAFLNSVLGGILALLGFSSCDNTVIGGMAMYGQPHADFTVKGTVTDEDGNPVEGIRTVVDSYLEWTDHAGYEYSQLDLTDTLYTGSDGKVQMKSSIFDAGRLVVTLTDVDGEMNGGTFEEQVIEDLQVNKTKEGEGWYTGAYEAEFKATLKKID